MLNRLVCLPVASHWNGLDIGMSAQTMFPEQIPSPAALRSAQPDGNRYRDAMPLDAKAAHEFEDRHAVLELDSVEGHRIASR